MVNSKASAKKQPTKANAAGKTRKVDKQKVKSSKSLTSLLLNYLIPVIFLFITVIWKLEKKKTEKMERLNLKNHFFAVFPKKNFNLEYHDAS